jgi:hypothetical protein
VTSTRSSSWDAVTTLWLMLGATETPMNKRIIEITKPLVIQLSFIFHHTPISYGFNAGRISKLKHGKIVGSDSGEKLGITLTPKITFGPR